MTFMNAATCIQLWVIIRLYRLVSAVVHSVSADVPCTRRQVTYMVDRFCLTAASQNSTTTAFCVDITTSFLAGVYRLWIEIK